MIFKDYYKILGLETSRVGTEDIKKAYRNVAKKYHPDLNVGDKLAEERIKDINEAYRILSNKTAKRKYDRIWNSNVGRKRIKGRNQESSVFEDFFNMFFGNIDEKDLIVEKSTSIRGENIETEIDLPIEEGYFGTKKKIVLKNIEGKEKKLDVQIPAGIQDGEKIRLIGQGKTGKNGGKNGDLYLKINLKDSKNYKLIGKDIHTSLLITPWEAALGSNVELKTIDGTQKININKGIQNGEKIEVENRGYKDKDGSRGKLIAEVKIVMPKKLNDKEIEIFKELNKISKFNPRASEVNIK